MSVLLKIFTKILKNLSKIPRKSFPSPNSIAKTFLFEGSCGFVMVVINPPVEAELGSEIGGGAFGFKIPLTKLDVPETRLDVNPAIASALSYLETGYCPVS